MCSSADLHNCHTEIKSMSVAGPLYHSVGILWQNAAYIYITEDTYRLRNDIAASLGGEKRYRNQTQERNVKLIISLLVLYMQYI